MEQQCSGQVNKREKTWGNSFRPCKKIGVLEVEAARVATGKLDLIALATAAMEVKK